MASVICVGLAVMDQIFRLKTLPKSAGKYFAEDYLEVGGGPAATASVTIAKLGGNVELWGRVGDDQIGDRIVEELSEYGVNTDYVKRIPSSPSSISAVMVDSTGERLIVGRPVHTLDPDASWLPLDRISTKDAVLTDSSWLNGATAALKEARRVNIPTILDADQTREQHILSLLKFADHIIFSERGLHETTGIYEIDLALKKAQRDHHRLIGVTQGTEGTYWLEEGQMKHQSAFSVEVVDTLGAGDVFHGALALAIAEQQPIPEAIQFASATAALKCRLPGGRQGIPNRAGVNALIQSASGI